MLTGMTGMLARMTRMLAKMAGVPFRNTNFENCHFQGRLDLDKGEPPGHI